MGVCSISDGGKHKMEIQAKCQEIWLKPNIIRITAHWVCCYQNCWFDCREGAAAGVYDSEKGHESERGWNTMIVTWRIWSSVSQAQPWHSQWSEYQRWPLGRNPAIPWNSGLLTRFRWPYQLRNTWTLQEWFWNPGRRFKRSGGVSIPQGYWNREVP